MRRRQRREEYDSAQYPSRETFFDRRRFLLSLGKVSGVVVMSLSFDRRLLANDDRGQPRSSELVDGTFQVEMPGAPNFRELPVEKGHPYRYRVTVVVAGRDIATFVEQNYLTLFAKLDDALQPYTYDDLRAPDSRTAAEGKLLQTVRDAHCAMATCGSNDFVSLTLTTEPYYDQTIGCNIGSVPWKEP